MEHCCSSAVWSWAQCLVILMFSPCPYEFPLGFQVSPQLPQNCELVKTVMDCIHCFRLGFGSTVTLTRIQQLMKINECYQKLIPRSVNTYEHTFSDLLGHQFTLTAIDLILFHRWNETSDIIGFIIFKKKSDYLNWINANTVMWLFFIWFIWCIHAEVCSLLMLSKLLIHLTNKQWVVLLPHSSRIPGVMSSYKGLPSSPHVSVGFR